MVPIRRGIEAWAENGGFWPNSESMLRGNKVPYISQYSSIPFYVPPMLLLLFLYYANIVVSVSNLLVIIIFAFIIILFLMFIRRRWIRRCIIHHIGTPSPALRRLFLSQCRLPSLTSLMMIISPGNCRLMDCCVHPLEFLLAHCGCQLAVWFHSDSFIQFNSFFILIYAIHYHHNGICYFLECPIGECPNPWTPNESISQKRLHWRAEDVPHGNDWKLWWIQNVNVN